MSVNNAIDLILESIKRSNNIDTLLGRASRTLHKHLNKGHGPMGLKEDLAQAVDDIDTAVAANDVSRDAQVAALQAQIDLLSANPSDADVQAAIDRLRTAKDKLIADSQ